MAKVETMKTWLWTALHPEGGDERWWGDSRQVALARLAVELCRYWDVEKIDEGDVKVWEAGGFVVAEGYL